MDPNANLAEQRRLVARIMGVWDTDPGTDDSAMLAAIGLPDVLRLAELVQAMDGWLAAGGFKPAAWNRLEK